MTSQASARNKWIEGLLVWGMAAVVAVLALGWLLVLLAMIVGGVVLALANDAMVALRRALGRRRSASPTMAAPAGQPARNAPVARQRPILRVVK